MRGGGEREKEKGGEERRERKAAEKWKDARTQSGKGRFEDNSVSLKVFVDDCSLDTLFHPTPSDLHTHAHTSI